MGIAKPKRLGNQQVQLPSIEFGLAIVLASQFELPPSRAPDTASDDASYNHERCQRATALDEKNAATHFRPTAQIDTFLT